MKWWSQINYSVMRESGWAPGYYSNVAKRRTSGGGTQTLACLRNADPFEVAWRDLWENVSASAWGVFLHCSGPFGSVMGLLWGVRRPLGRPMWSFVTSGAIRVHQGPFWCRRWSCGDKKEPLSAHGRWHWWREALRLYRWDPHLCQTISLKSIVHSPGCGCNRYHWPLNQLSPRCHGCARNWNGDHCADKNGYNNRRVCWETVAFVQKPSGCESHCQMCANIGTKSVIIARAWKLPLVLHSHF